MSSAEPRGPRKNLTAQVAESGCASLSWPVLNALADETSRELGNVLAALDNHAIVATTDVQGRITFVNDKLCESSGYSHEELLGQNFRMLNSGFHSKAFFASLYQTIAAGRVWHGEVRNVAKDGHFSWAQTTITPFMGKDDKPEKYVVIRTDITQLKLAEFELQLHRDHLKELVQQKTADLQQTIGQKKRALAELQQQKFVLDQHASVTITDVAGRITYANDKFSEISGYAREEVMGQDHHFLNSGHHPKGFFKTMYETINQGEVWHAEVCNRAKDGHLYWEEATFSAFMGEERQPREYIGIRTDISERKRAEQAAQAANQAKSEFLANMSHEIRTPMNGVVGMIDVLKQTELKPEQRRVLDTIYKSSLSLLTILSDILDLSKIEAGKLGMESLPTHLREVAEDVALLLSSSLTSKSIDLLVFVSPELPEWISCDPTRLRQVLLNLLGNAVKFSAEKRDTFARVMLSAVPCTLANGRFGLRLRVTDNGIGMSQHDLANLYQPFTQADESTARKFGGTGLGLSITQRLVKMMGGQISVRSVLGEGSEFSVELPLQASKPGRLQVFAHRLDGVHVLIVTDDAVVVQTIQAYCKSLGAHVDVVADLAAARNQVQSLLSLSGPTVAVLDTDIACTARELDLPQGVGVVRLVHGRSDASTGDITVSTRPLLYLDLIQGIALASGQIIAPHTPDHIKCHWPSPKTNAPSIEEACRSGRLLLLAEDNEINRDVIQDQLRLLGYASEVAEDGAMALTMWRTGRFALLLTDCHMPRMDGFELTEAIRLAEPPGTRMPIVAITANAMQGEAQRCRDRGIDDYLSKPLRLKELGRLLNKWLPFLVEKPVEEPIEKPVEAPVEASVDLPDAVLQNAALTGSPVWDAATLSSLVGGNPAVHRRLLDKFLMNATGQVANIGAAAAAGATDTVADVAHALKSAARSVGALALGDLCQRMETASCAKDMATCAALGQHLMQAFSDAKMHIQNHLALLPAA